LLGHTTGFLARAEAAGMAAAAAGMAAAVAFFGSSFACAAPSLFLNGFW